LLPARLPDWRRRFDAVLAAYGSRDFEWGSADCVTLALDTMKAITGVDPFESHRVWRNEFGSKRVMLRLGFYSIADVFSSVCPRTSASMARAGDIGVAIDGNTKNEVAIIFDGHKIIGMAPCGLTRLPLNAARFAYTVG